MEGMMKFNIQEQQYAFKVYNKSSTWMFKFGNGWNIFVYKEINKTKSYCKQHEFEYEGISNTLRGKEYPEYFTPKRIIVIEMK